MASRFRPFPKNADGTLAKERLRDRFLTGHHATWAEFCRAHRFNPSGRTQFPVQAWQMEWICQQIRRQDELLRGEATNLREDLLSQRLRSIRRQLCIAEKLHGLLDRELETQRKSIENGQEPDMGIKELVSLLAASRVLQEYEARALLLHRDTAGSLENLDPAFARVAEDEERGVVESLQSEEFRLLQPADDPGSLRLNRDEIIEGLAKWFDEKQTTTDAEPEEVASIG